MIPFPHIDPVAFEIPLFGGLPIRWYALAYIAGFLVGQHLMKRLVVRWPAAGLTPQHVESLFIYVVLGGILGGRLGYVLFYNLPFFLEHPTKILATWEGGMAFHGGIIGVGLALLLFCWRHGLNVGDVADRLVPAVPIGIFFGRVANFINGELWGRPFYTPEGTPHPWSMVFPYDPQHLPRHMSQLYEAGLEGVLLGLILWGLAAKQPQRWVLTGTFLAGYGATRFVVEYFRESDVQAYLETASLSSGQVLSVPLIILGAMLILSARLSPRSR